MPRMIFYRAFCVLLSSALFTATLPLQQALATQLAGSVTRGALYGDNDVDGVRAPASTKEAQWPANGTAAVLLSACQDPEHVRYSPRTRGPGGQYVYYRYLARPNAPIFECRGVGAGPVSRKLTVTQADICTDCDKSQGRGGPAQSLQEIAAQVSTTARAPQCPYLKIDARVFTSGLQCFDSAIKGIIASLMDLVKGIGYLANAGYEWVKGKLFSQAPVQRTDNMMTKVLNFLRTMTFKKYLELQLKPFLFLRDLAKAFAVNVYETSKNSANCDKWEGLPLWSKCLKEGPGWDCMSLNQKTQTVCAMVGSFGSDFAMLFVGGVTIGKLAAKSARLVAVVNKAREIAQAASMRAASVVAKGGRTVELAVRAASGTARMAAKIPIYSGKTVLRALSAVDKLPGFKQYAQLSEKAFLEGFKIGRSSGAVRTLGVIEATGRAARAADDVAGAESNFSRAEQVAMAAPPPANPHALQTSEQVAAQVRGRPGYKIESISRRKFVARNSTRNVIPEVENARFRVLMDNPTPGGRTVVLRDTAKKANNSNLSFNRSTAITTTYVERAALKFERLAKKYKGRVNITRFEGPNRLEVRIDPVGEHQLPATIEAELADIYKSSTIEQSDFLKRNRLVRENDDPADWFKYGSGPDSHTANLTVRSNAQFENQIATHRWEDRPTQAQLETVFNRAKSLHQTIRDRYKGTEIIDASGRINPKVAEIVSKSASPEDAIKKLLFYDDFIKPQGRLIPKAEQLRNAEEIMEYIDYSRSFGIEYYGTRTPLALKTEDTVCFGSDLCGQNGRNLSYNTTVFDGDFGNVVTASQDAERASTNEFRNLMDRSIGARTKVLESHGYQVETASSGDDISTVVRNQDGTPIEELPREVLLKMSVCTDGLACLRDTYVPARVQVYSGDRLVTLPKQDVIDITHDLEKRTRSKLSQMSRDFDKHNFTVEVSPNGVMKLQLSHDPHLPALQAVPYYDKLKKAEAAFQDVVKNTDPAVLRGLRIKLPPSPNMAEIKGRFTLGGKPAPAGAEYWIEALDLTRAPARGGNRSAQIRGLAALIERDVYSISRAEARLRDGRLVPMSGYENRRLHVPDSALTSQVALEKFLFQQSKNLRLDTKKLPRETRELLDNIYDRQGIVTYELDRADEAAGISHSDNLIGLKRVAPYDRRPIIIHEVTHNTSSRHIENILEAAPSARKVYSGRMLEFRSTHGNFPLHRLYKKYYRADEIEARVRELASRNFHELPGEYTLKDLHEFIDTQRFQLKDMLRSKRMRWEIAGIVNSPNQVRLRIEGLDYDVNIPYIEGETAAEKTTYIEDVLKKRIEYLDRLKKRLPAREFNELEMTPDMVAPSE